MPFMPFQILGMWLRGLIALAMIGYGAYLLKYWYDHREVEVVDRPVVVAPADANPAMPAPEPGQPAGVVVRREAWHFGWNAPTAALLGGLALLTLSVVGRPLASPRLLRPAGDEPDATPRGEVRRLRRDDGTELHVELVGPEEGTPLVLTHGWGVDSDEWNYLRQHLGPTQRLILWDLRGLGRSSQPTDRDYSLEAMARDLDAVIDLAGGRPVTLVGHSIGGMIMLTYCRLFPQNLGRRVAALAMAHTTPTNPVLTASGAPFYAAIQKPILEPLMYLTIGLSPLVRLMNAISYWNGSAHRSTERSSFSGNETRGQLDFMARYTIKESPAVLARGMLAMFRYDATAALPTIPVPTLVVVGDQDNVTLPEAGAAIARGVPHGTLHTLAPARHGGHFEHHARFAEALRAFVIQADQPLGARSA